MWISGGVLRDEFKGMDLNVELRTWIFGDGFEGMELRVWNGDHGIEGVELRVRISGMDLRVRI